MAVQRRAAMPPVIPLLAALVLALVAGCKSEEPAPPPPPPPAGQAPQRLPTATIRVGTIPLSVEVAKEEAARRQGMMFRERLGPDEAMLFVFDRNSNLAFWMKNTPVDLDLAYIRSDGTVTQTEQMKAHVLEPVHSREPVRFALETPAGWLKAHDVGVGTKVAIPPEVAAIHETP